MPNNLTDAQIDRIIYMIEDYSSEKAGRKATPSLIDLKIKDYDEKLTPSLDKRFLEAEKHLASKKSLERVEGKVDNLITISNKTEGFVRGVKFLWALLFGVLSLLGYVGYKLTIDGG